MKKIILFLALAIFSLGIYAQLWPYDEVTPTATDTLLLLHNDSVKVATVSNLTDRFDESLYGGNYFVATWGSDAGDGSFTDPWLSWDDAFNALSAGDTLYIRGGVYYPAGTWGSDESYCVVFVEDSDGADGNRISVFNYPGEKPILDCSLMNVEDMNTGILLFSCEYWHLKGLTVRNVPQQTTSPPNGFSVGIWLQQTGETILENMTAHNNGGIGFHLYHGFDSGEPVSIPGNKLINCDAYNNYDPYSAIDGGDGDGFGLAENPFITDSLILIGCRSWNNSDDGFDMWGTEGIVALQGCWSFNNGVADGDGGGFKMGSEAEVTSTFVRQLYNCITSGNRGDGINESEKTQLMKYVNVTAYLNREKGVVFNGDDVACIYQNILSYDNTNGDFGTGTITAATFDHNSYDASKSPNGPVVTDADFFSLDTMQLYRPRKPDGSLPDITLLTLRPESNLVEGGIDVGLDYFGLRPDIGAIESGITGDAFNFAADGESDDAYEVSLPRITALVVGMQVTFTANTLNTGAATLEITTVGDVDAILKMNDQPLVTGDIEANQAVVVFWDGSNWQMMSQLAQ